MKKLLLIGVSHKTAQVERRERLSLSEAALPDFLGRISGAPAVAEAVVLSTCNRLEVYVLTESPSAARELIEKELAARWGEGAPPWYVREDLAAVRHLFHVAAGLDSLVIGEGEILGQVKRAYEAALGARGTGKFTNVLFQRALYVGKLVRAETRISEGATSSASVAVSLAGKIFGDLTEKNILIVGAGKMAELSARNLLSQKAARLTVANRTLDKATELAGPLGGRAVPLEDLPEELLVADIVICSTGAPTPLVRAADVRDIMARRRGRALFFIDIAVPRDVESEVNGIENVYLYNIDDLQAIVSETVGRRRSEIEKATLLADRKAEEFCRCCESWQAGRPAPFAHSDFLSRSSVGGPAADATFLE